MRQSITTRISAPILWYGDLVDFGSFDKSVFDINTGSSIAFKFGLDKIISHSNVWLDTESFQGRNIVNKYDDIDLSVSIVKQKTGTRVSSIGLRDPTNEANYVLTISDDNTVGSFRVNDIEMIGIFREEILYISPGAILPQISTRPRSPQSAIPTDYPFRAPTNISIRKAISDILKPALDGRTIEGTLYRLVSSIIHLNPVSKEKIRDSLKETSNRSWTKLIMEITGVDRQGRFALLRNLILVVNFMSLLNRTSTILREIISSSLYIGPARARSERYYRYQDLAVSEIDPDGKNFPMFLSSLRESQLRSFSTWVQSIFGYGVDISRESGHISINLVSDIGNINVVDTGYGVSQILPVLGQVWWARNRPSKRPALAALSPPILLIEQPELHLHPAHQALLADTLVNSSKEQADGRSYSGMHFIVETHSEALINRLGALIALKQISADSTQVLIFEDDEDDPRASSIRIANFDDDGFLQNWPFGFFLPDV